MMMDHKTAAERGIVIDGKHVARGLRQSIAHHVEVLVNDHKIMPGLAVVLVGDDPASQIYVANKEKKAAAAGLRSYVHRLPKNTSQDALLDLLHKLNKDKKIHGILVQMPLPRQIDTATVLRAIDPRKDVDGLHIENVGRLAAGLPGLVPCTPLGCLTLLRGIVPNMSGLHAVVVGRSNLVGKPMAQLLLRENCTVTVAHSRTPDLPHITRLADILVVATGRAQMVKADWVKPGAIVLDVGINRAEGRIVGDVDFAAVREVAGYITPVPGGVGPMTIACLLGNTVAACCRQNELTVPELR
ncbi:MAG: bifunctional methylenetetrahydrofolate dehydrogenase/methenyltetrahydrofolate cyclohydrolase FolD [Bdellovibrionales bacterium]|jgi:methylenetetrahydrofolate dehydrogenase (NADP+)/methenyltetrahydrofolate cyclohydrolase|nr:bifunctional methylenetetrahydrofolate dehydrogenase/methenyltetrahydrofolate cyclohydrolase FolD [Bdellovibrionales bacterium]